MKIIVTNHDGAPLGITFTTPDESQETISLATGKKVVWPIGTDRDPFGSVIIPRGPGWTFLVEKDGDGVLLADGVEVPPGGRMYIRRPTEPAYVVAFTVVAEPTAAPKPKVEKKPEPVIPPAPPKPPPRTQPRTPPRTHPKPKPKPPIHKRKR